MKTVEEQSDRLYSALEALLRGLAKDGTAIDGFVDGWNATNEYANWKLERAIDNCFDYKTAYEGQQRSIDQLREENERLKKEVDYQSKFVTIKTPEWHYWKSVNDLQKSAIKELVEALEKMVDATGLASYTI